MNTYVMVVVAVFALSITNKIVILYQQDTVRKLHLVAVDLALEIALLVWGVQSLFSTT